MPSPRKGDLYWAEIRAGQAAGSEQFGRRPWVIVSSDYINAQLPIVIAVPLSRQTHKQQHRAHRILVPTGEMIQDPQSNSTLGDSIALTEQVRVLSVDRLDSKIGKLTPTAVAAIEAGLSFVFGIP